MVGGQFHHERSRIARERSGLLQDHARDDDRRHADKVRGSRHPGGTAEDRARDHRDKRHFRAAGDEGRGHDGHAAVALVLNGARRHDPGDPAARADQHRDKGFARQTEATEDPVEYERDARHVPARLEDREEQEEHQHLRYEPEHRADARDDTVEDQPGEPIGGVRRVKTFTDQCRNTGDPRTVVGGVGLVEAGLFKVGKGVAVGHRVDVVPGVVGHRVEVDGDLDRFKGLFILDLDRGGRLRRLCQPGAERGERRVCVEVFRFIIEFDVKRRGGVVRGCPIVRRRLVFCRADPEHMPTVAEQSVVCPVGRGGADRHHRDPIDQKHHEREDRKPEPAVGDDPVDLIRRRLSAGLLLFVARLDDARDIEIPFVCDDAFRVVLKFAFRRGDVLFDVRHDVARDIQVGEHLVVALEHLDRVPTLPLLGKSVERRLLDVGERVLDRTREGVLRDGLTSLRRLDRRFRRLHDAGALQGGDLHHAAAELARQFGGIDLIAVLVHEVDHIDRDHHRDPEFGQLGRQVQVPFQVGAVEDIQDRVGALPDQVIPGDDLFERVGRERIDTRQVGDHNAVVPFQFPLFLLDRHPRPVSDELVGTRQSVEQRRFPAVGVPRKCNTHSCFSFPARLPSANRTAKK